MLNVQYAIAISMLLQHVRYKFSLQNLFPELLKLCVCVSNCKQADIQFMDDINDCYGYFVILWEMTLYRSMYNNRA